jgi:diguanylate cyclase (GGDEF)-like protein/PAS domain S-box-containing protein
MSSVSKSAATLWPAIRISFVLILITASLILTADFLGITPSQTRYELENRKQLSESMAVLFSTMASESDLKKVRTVLSKIVMREQQLLSAGFRMKSGNLLFEVGPHVKQWSGYKDSKSTSTHVLVPVFRDRKSLGFIELRFSELASLQGISVFKNTTYQLIIFVFVFGFLCFLFFMLNTLRQIDPAAVIPDRVNAAFDTLSEGLVILDDKEQIVLANKAFSELINRESAKLLGIKLSGLTWKMAEEQAGEVLFPWLIALSTGESSIGDMLVLEASKDDVHTLTVNCAPILDSKGNQQGVLLTFDDVTEIEIKKQQLQETVLELKTSKKEIQQKNKELHYLATRDPMTGCLNRRSFNDLFAEAFADARSQDKELTCLMVDIDHFKLVNDNYGHGVGDEVIKMLANVLLSSTRDEDIVSRYGGEEFCIILPGIDIDEAVSIAERIRLKIKKDSVANFEAGPHITASLGVSSIYDHAKDPAELNDQADQGLYVAKENGRNRVISWASKNAVETEPDSKVEDKTDDKSRIPLSDHARQAEEIKQLQVQIRQLENAASDVSEQLLNQQNFDKLTGLPSQTLFYDRLKHAIDRADRKNQLSAVLVIHFDLFAQANNSYGLGIAEKMFGTLSNRISTIFRKTDTIAIVNFNMEDVTVSRFEGDEFGILLPDLEDHMMVTWTIKRIFDALNKPISFEDKEVSVTCSIGISVFPEDARSAEELLSHANTAKSFENKDFSKNSFQFYNASMQEKSLKQLGLEAEIKRAIKNQEWVLYYQPKVDISTSEITGMEALIRWNHPERGLLSPFEFIDFAEERGLIVEIGEWVLRTACKQVKVWSDKGFNIKMAVNLSSVQLYQAQLSNQVLDIIKDAEIKPQQLELEVTETMLMVNLETAVKTLNRLHCSGITISIDDFGTGYSSFGYLKQLPIDVLKIDRLFVKDLMTDEYDKNIVNTIISMAHGMDLKVIAEGVETEEQHGILRQMSCDEMQGYLFSKPVDAESATKLLEQ